MRVTDLDLEQFIAQCKSCKDTFVIDYVKRYKYFESQLAFTVRDGQFRHRCGGLIRIFTSVPISFDIQTSTN